MKSIKQILLFLFIIFQFQSFSQSTWIRLELDVKQMLNPSCNLNMGDVDSNKVYAHLGLCTCKEQSPFGPKIVTAMTNQQTNCFVLLKLHLFNLEYGNMW